jgi:uncharacterized cupin superfamily protein
MKRINQNDLPWNEQRSPKGKYHRYHRDLVRALQAPQAEPALPPGVPFDVALMRLPAGATNYPFHAHFAEWECYVILSGSGTVRHGAPDHDDGEQRTPVAPGDCIVFPPRDPHQLINDGDADLLYYVIANNAPAEVGHFPDSNKWVIRGTGAFRRTDVPYFEDEE